jgi:hypothetical protein
MFNEGPSFELGVAYRLAQTMPLTVMAQMMKGVAAEIRAVACPEEELKKCDEACAELASCSR